MVFKIENSRLKKIFALSLPIIAGMLSQNLLNLVDTAMVGRLGAEELAAVGLSSMVAFLFLSPVLGVSSGVQAIAARKKGEGKLKETAFALNDSLIFSLLFSCIVLALGFMFAKPLFNMLTETETLAKLSSEYFLIRISACFFAIMNFAFRGYWNAVDLSKVYMRTLIIMHIVNVILNYLLIFGEFGFPRMETNGAALATSISIAIGFVLYFVQAMDLASENGFLKCFPCNKNFAKLVRISIPAGFELAITMSNVVALYWLVGKIGTEELATLNILMNIFMVALLPALGLGITLATLSGQSLGAGNKEDSFNWGKDVGRLSLSAISLIALVFFFVPKSILAIFTTSENVISLGHNALRIMGFTLGLEMIGYVFVEALKGLGYSNKVSVISFVWQWVIFLPGAMLLVFIFKQGLFVVWIWQIIMHLLQSAIFIYIWKKRKWQDQKYTQ